MNHRYPNITLSQRFTVCVLPVLLLAAFSAPAPAVTRTVYTVGTSADCTHQHLSDALHDAVIDLSAAEIDIHVARTIDTSLGYSYAGRNSEIKLSNQQPIAIVIAGGYSSCSASGPMVGQTTTLGYHNASVDQGHTLLTISNATSNQHVIVSLSRITMQGSQAGDPPAR